MAFSDNSSSHPTGIQLMRGFREALPVSRAHDGPGGDDDEESVEAVPAAVELVQAPPQSAPLVARSKDVVIVRHPVGDLEMKVLEVVITETTVILLFERQDKVALNPKIGAKFAINFKGVDYGVCAVHDLVEFRTQPCQACIFVRVNLDESYEDGKGGTG